jgi:hypothetical protein
MRLYDFKTLLLATAAAQVINAHTLFTNFYVDGINQGNGTCVRMSKNTNSATNPIKGITSDDMACGKWDVTLGSHAVFLTVMSGVNGQNGVERVCAAQAGSRITFEFHVWADGTVPGAIDPSHKGPCAVYMKKVDSAITDRATGGGWFNIFKDDYDQNANQWCTEKLITNNGRLSVTIPNDLEPGAYLVRPELLALHEADKNPADPQFYVGCAQVFLTSGGSAKPTDTVSIPGHVDMSLPAMTYHIWDSSLKLPFPQFGPPTYSSQSSKRGLHARATLTQTEGLKPKDCLIENGNWCGVKLPSSSDEGSCWAVRVYSFPFDAEP